MNEKTTTPEYKFIVRLNDVDQPPVCASVYAVSELEARRRILGNIYQMRSTVKTIELLEVRR